MHRTVRIIQRRELFKRAFFRIEEATFQHDRFDGSTSPELTRLVLHRGDSVAILLHDLARQTVLLVEQFRYPTYEHGPGWLVELPAGVVEPDESPEQCVRREVLEETGYQLDHVRRIGTVYLSPGGSSERIHLFYGPFSFDDKTGEGGGVAAEGEDIRLVCMPLDVAFSQAHDGQVLDAKTLVALQWLEIELTRPQH